MQHTSFINYRANAGVAGCTEGPRIRTDPQRMKYISGNEEELNAHLSLLLMGVGGSAHSLDAAECKFSSWNSVPHCSLPAW